MSFISDMLGLTPDTPDYTGAAQAQADASKALTLGQTYANRPTMTTPWGTQSWTTGSRIDPSTGKPVTTWQGNLTLNPKDQQALDAQRSIQLGRSQGAQTLLGQAVSNFQKPTNWGALPPAAMSFNQGGGGQPTQQGKFGSQPSSGASGGAQTLSAPGGGTDWRQSGQDAAMKFLNPIEDQRQSALENQLANQGMTRGSEGWNNELRNFNDQRTRDQLQIFDSGRNEAQFGLTSALQQGQFNNQNRQQAINEETQRRSQTLNELNALLTGQQVNQPQMPGFNQAGVSQAPNLMGALTNGYQADLNSSNAGNAFLGNIASAFAFSDARLKEDIRTVGRLSSGLRVVQFRFKGTAPICTGVIAQEVQEVFPHAVVRHKSGYLMVNYAEIF